MTNYARGITIAARSLIPACVGMLFLCSLLIAPIAAAKTQLPVQTVDVRLSNGHQEDFVGELHVIAGQLGYAIREAPRISSPTGDIFVELWRNDGHVAVDNMYHHDIFSICFYSLGLVPKEAEAAAQADFIAQLRRYTKRIPGGATLTIEK